MDNHAAIEIIDQAVDAIDEFDVAYRLSLDSEGPRFHDYWDQSLELERTGPADLNSPVRLRLISAQQSYRLPTRPISRCTERIPSRRTAMRSFSLEHACPSKRR